MPQFTIYYLWEELRRIEWGIKAEGYTSKEMTQLERSLDDVEEMLADTPTNLDLANYSIVRQLNLLN